MEYLKSKKIKNPILSALAVSLIGLAFALMLGYLRLEENDDAFISNIYANVWGAGYTEYAVYVNVLLGLLLKPLYLWKSTVNWYVLWNLVMCFLSFWAISWLLIRRWKNGIGIALSLAVNLFFCWEHYCMFQYTKNAYLILVAGFLLFLDGLENEKGTRRLWQKLLPGILLILFGYMLRSSCFMVVAVFAGVCVLGDLLREGKWGRYVSWIAVTGVLLLSVTIFDWWYYQRDPSWAYYQEYNEARTTCIDYGMPGYEAYQEEYESIGFSEVERFLMDWWVYADPEVYTLETVQEIASWRTDVGIGRLNLHLDTIKEMYDEIIEEWLYLIPVVVLWLGLLLSDKKRKNGELLCFPVLILLLYWYLVCNGRVVHRAVYGIWLAAVVFMICRGELPEKEKYSGGFWAAGLLFLLSASVWGKEAVLQREENLGVNYQELWQYIENDKEHLYLIDTITVVKDGMESGSPLGTPGSESRSNVYLLGGWQVPTPTTNAVLENYGITNPFRELAERNEDVILVDNELVKQKEEYLQRNYDEDAKLQLIGQVGGFDLYVVAGTGE